MILIRFFDEKLAQSSYLIGCGTAGEAVVVDANRDTDQYIRAAESEGLEIAHVTETHIHADFVSGSRELAARTGARLYLSDEGDADWRYAFAAEAGAVPLREGSRIEIGNVSLAVLHTPGHTPEHISFLVTDGAVADEPMGILTGDFVFVGDVGRPDLLEKAANVEGTMEASARLLFDSVRRLRAQPDHLQIWPGHGAGSACGKGISQIPQSTLGYERRFSWGFAVQSADEFVASVLADQPEPPKYFAEMKRVNRLDPPVRDRVERPVRLPEGRLERVLGVGGLVIDTRDRADFAAGHVPGSINIPLNRGFTTWAGWLVPYDRDFFLILDDRCPPCLEEAVRDLTMIGLERMGGFFGSDAVQAWRARGGVLQQTPQITGEAVRGRLRSEPMTVLDVRGAAEWRAGHVPGSLNIPVGYLLDRLDEIPRDSPVAVHCERGARAAIASSVLQAAGFTQVSTYGDGFPEWKASGAPVERAEAASFIGSEARPR